MDQNIAKNIWQSLVLAVMAEKSIECARVILSFATKAIIRSTALSYRRNCWEKTQAENVRRYTKHNDEWVNISQKNIWVFLIWAELTEKVLKIRQ